MTLRILKTVQENKDGIERAKEVPFAYLDGSMVGIDALIGQPIKITIINDQIEGDVETMHSSMYSRRALKAELTALMKQAGPLAFDALSQFADLKDSSCLIWDDSRPYELNSTKSPIIENGPPLPGQVQQDDDEGDHI